MIFLLLKSHIVSYPISIKSTFQTDLKINSIDLNEFGKMFKFEWLKRNISSLYPITRPNEQQYGIIKENSTTLIGFLKFDSKLACKKECYLGLEPPGKKTSPIVDFKSIDISSIEKLDQVDASFLYNLWIKSFKLSDVTQTANGKSSSKLKLQTQISDAFILDSKLINLFQTRLNNLRRNEDLFASKLKINIQSSAIQKNEEGKKGAHENDDKNDLSYSFNIKFKFMWPHFLLKTHQITFPRTQIHVEHKIKNLTIQNPSNSTVHMQIILMNGFVKFFV